MLLAILAEFIRPDVLNHDPPVPPSPPVRKTKSQGTGSRLPGSLTHDPPTPRQRDDLGSVFAPIFTTIERMTGGCAQSRRTGGRRSLRIRSVDESVARGHRHTSAVMFAMGPNRSSRQNQQGRQKNLFNHRTFSDSIQSDNQLHGQHLTRWIILPSNEMSSVEIFSSHGFVNSGSATTSQPSFCPSRSM